MPSAPEIGKKWEIWTFCQSAGGLPAQRSLGKRYEIPTRLSLSRTTNIKLRRRRLESIMDLFEYILMGWFSRRVRRLSEESTTGENGAARFEGKSEFDCIGDLIECS